MKRVLWLGAILSVAGCAPRVVSANSAGGIVNLTGSIDGQRKAMEQANADCAKYGKVARSQGFNFVSNNMRYECVTP